MEIPSLAGAGPSAAAMGSAITSPLLRGALDTISQQLGLERAALESALATGVSVDELAARQGVSSTELHSAVVAQIGGARAQAGQAAIEPETLGRMVARAFAQGRRSAPVIAGGPAVARDPLSIYGSAGRVVGEGAGPGISVLA